MKKIFIIFAFVLFALQTNAQEMNNSNVQVGDALIIQKPSTPSFKHIYFPKDNFIIKRGGIVNYDNIYANEVHVVKIVEKKDGSQEVVLQRTDGKKFFKTYNTVRADLTKALESGELTKKT
ncbi:hypothetical protein [Namhaeicola litoreus]|uniref:Uncharacterized protein n=1 Tax=Namhaeicola litoreus TaxID=1052145 RepID=A0ABW3Y3I7_9FLAO